MTQVKRALALCLVASVAPFLSAAPADLQPDSAAVRIRFGMRDTQSTDWSGKITPSQGRVTDIRGWRWGAGDAANVPAGTWTVHTNRVPAQGEAAKKAVKAGRQMPMADNGVVVTLAGAGDGTKFDVETQQGKADFTLGDIPYGKRLVFLDGQMEIERTPAVAPLAQTTSDEDYPAAAAARDGAIYVAYLAFTRGADFQGYRERLATPEVSPESTVLSVGRIKMITKPQDMDYLTEPTGGERLYLRAFKNGAWGEPMVVAGGPEEYYRPAVAVDGSGKAWVFYPAHTNADAHFDNGNWEVMARAFDPAANKFADPVNVSHAPGSDFMCAAAADSQGQVHLVWMGAKEGKFHVYTARQDGAKFTEPARVSNSSANEWDPAIACDPKTGNVAIAWDAYDRGDYDVHLVTSGPDGKFSDPVPVAATNNFEVRPSLAYDGESRLWVAWEQSGENWGKDFGGLKKFGIPIYSGEQFGGGRSLGVKVLRYANDWLKPANVMDAVPTGAVGNAGAGGAAGAKMRNIRRANIAPCYPRLCADDQGRVWMAFRGRPAGPQWRVNVGGVWFEYVTRYEGDHWMPAAWVPRSNNVLDNRPALVATHDHQVLMAYSGDGRGDVQPERIGDPHAGEGVGATPADAAKLQPGAPGNPPAPPEARPPQQEEQAAPAAKGKKGKKGKKAGGGGRNAQGPDPNQDIYVTLLSPTDAGKNPPANQLEAIQPEKAVDPPQQAAAEEAAVKTMRDYRSDLNGQNLRIWRGEFHRHTEFSPDGMGDGGILDLWRYVLDAISFDWIGDGDHDYGNGREYTWWTTQKLVTLFTVPDHFVPMFSYERSVVYPEGHRNCVFAVRGVRSLPRLPLSAESKFAHAPDTQLLYQYLKRFDGVCAPHTSGTNMGTDWRDHDPLVEPMVEIYQGDRNNYERPDAPRSADREAKLKNSTPEVESFGGYRPKGYVNNALKMGYRLAFESSSDHISTHLSYCNVYVTEPSRAAILEGMKKRRVYGSTDNILADLRVTAGGKEHFMGEEFTGDKAPTLRVKLVGTRELADVVVIKDDQVVHEIKPNQKEVSFEWTDPSPTRGKTSYYYVRGEQVPDMPGVTGELVWISPVWITYQQ